MAQSSKQLNINFDQPNAIRDKMRAGEFSLFVEYMLPSSDQPIKLGMMAGEELMKCLNRQKEWNVSLCLTDTDAAGSTHDVVAVAEEVKRLFFGDFMVRLCAAGRSHREIRETLAGLQSAGVTCVIAASGKALPDHPRDRHGNPLAAPERYLDSPLLIRLLRKEYPETYAGAVINPFKYGANDSFLQYFKMMKKLNTGAGFLVTQAGWDMKKYQELQWYLCRRGVNDPVLARLVLVRPPTIEAVLNHKMGGMVMSREFAAMLQREAALNDAQSLSAQMQRLCLQVAGCKLMGYSGIVIGGLPDARITQAVLKRSYEAMAEYRDFNTWLDQWNDFHDRVEMAPTSSRFYVFKSLLTRDVPLYEEKTVQQQSVTLPLPTRPQKLRFIVADALKLDGKAGPVWTRLRKLICGTRGKRYWHLKKTFYHCAVGCPKGLEEGPCGCSRPDQTCEFGHRPCFHHRILALAEWQKDLEMLEAPCEG